MTRFRPGDVVKLTHRYATTLMKSPKCRIDWSARRGLVKSVNSRCVYIVWDGCLDVNDPDPPLCGLHVATRDMQERLENSTGFVSALAPVVDKLR